MAETLAVAEPVVEASAMPLAEAAVADAVEADAAAADAPVADAPVADAPVAVYGGGDPDGELMAAAESLVAPPGEAGETSADQSRQDEEGEAKDGSDDAAAAAASAAAADAAAAAAKRKKNGKRQPSNREATGEPKSKRRRVSPSVDGDFDDCMNCPLLGVVLEFWQRFGEEVMMPRMRIDDFVTAICHPYTSANTNLLSKVHVPLLRRLGKNVSETKWQPTLMAWRWGDVSDDKAYEDLTFEERLDLLHEIEMAQFDHNDKFRKYVATLGPEQLRHEPCGWDMAGNRYWYMADSAYVPKLFRETLLWALPENDEALLRVELSETGEAVDDQLCVACKKPDDDDLLLLCDSCPRAYHTYCLRIKLPGVPEGDWFCPVCQQARLATQLATMAEQLELRSRLEERQMRRLDRLQRIGGIDLENVVTDAGDQGRQRRERRQVQRSDFVHVDEVVNHVERRPGNRLPVEMADHRPSPMLPEPSRRTRRHGGPAGDDVAFLDNGQQQQHLQEHGMEGEQDEGAKDQDQQAMMDVDLSSSLPPHQLLERQQVLDGAAT